MREGNLRLRVLALSAVLACSGAASAIDVFMNWTGSDATMNGAWAAAGYTLPADALTAAERDAIRASARTQMQTHYNGFNVNFTTTNPGGIFESLIYGATTTTTGLFGQATRIDWRNAFKNDSADIYLRNFDIVLSSTTYTRAQNLARFATSIAGTSSHELGHNLGLQHYDAYGQSSIRAPGYGGIVGQQNDSIMATGSTGLSLTQRGVPRAFNPLELVKLEYADGVAPTLGTTVAEQGGAHNSIGSAQLVAGTVLPISGLRAVNIRGGLSSAADVDFYRFTATAGSLITANTFSQSTFGDPVDTIITFFDGNGIQLFTNDDIAFNGNTFNSGGTYGTDSIMLNFQASVTGDYYVRVTPFSGSGNYDLLLTTTNVVPEPATLAVLGIGALAMLRRRKRAN